MQLKDIKKEGIFTTLYYELTWKIGWEQLLSILDVVIRTDFQEKRFQSLAVGMIAGTTPQDVTRTFWQTAATSDGLLLPKGNPVMQC